MNASHSGGRRRPLSAATAAALVVGALAALTGQATPAQAVTDDGLVYTCTYGSLGTDLRTPMSVDTDLPASSTVLAPLQISTSVTLVMPQAVAAQLQELPGFKSGKLSPDAGNDGVAETYLEPNGTGTPVTAHPVLAQQSANSDGSLPFSGSSPAPYAMNPGPSIPGSYSVTVGAMAFELVVDATTPVTYHVTCAPPSPSGALVDSFEVTAPTTTAITQSPATWAYGESPSGVTATVTRTGSTASWPAAAGVVQFYADGRMAGDPVTVGSDGTATLAHLPTLTPGNHAITAAYQPNGTSPYVGSTADATNARVEIATTTTVTVDPTSPEVDEPTRATATVSGSDGSTAPGQVTFTVDGIALDPETLSDGTATADLPTGVIGHHTVSASYAGTGLYRGSQSSTSAVEVAPHATAIKLSLDKTSSSFAEPVTATASVSSAGGDPTGMVTFTVGGESVSAPVQDGVAHADLPKLDAGTYAVDAAFVPGPDSLFSSSNADAQSLAVSITPTTTTLRLDETSDAYGDAHTATATVSSAFGTPTGTVTFTVDGRSVSAPVQDGVAHADLPDLRAGTYAVTAEFTPATDGTYAASSSQAESLVISPAATTTSLSLGETSTVYGNPVTATATVSSAFGTPTGTVTFTVGGRSVSAPLKDGGARATLPEVPAGSYDVSAVFVPAAPETFDSSTAQPRSLTVRSASTTTTLRIAPGTASYRGRATATARVTAAAGEPTGTVSFKVDGRSLAGALVNGTARVVLPTLQPGSYRVIATYLPARAGTFESSTSAAVSYAVSRDTSWIGQTITRTHRGKQLKCRVQVHARHAAETVTGEVRVVLASHGRAARTRAVRLGNGTGAVRFAAPLRGRWTVTATYLGNETVAGSVAVRHGRSRH